MAEISKSKLPLSYPIKRLTYLEMQQLRDQGLCLNCNSKDTFSHLCLVKRIVLVLPDEDPYAEQQLMESFCQPPQFGSATSAAAAAGSPPLIAPANTAAVGTISIGPATISATAKHVPATLTSAQPMTSEIQHTITVMEAEPRKIPDPIQTAVVIDQEGGVIFYYQKAVAKMDFETLQSPLEMSINQLGNKNIDAPLFSHLDDGMKIQIGCQNSFASIEQYGHKLFDVMLEKDANKIFERKIFIFDPGGTFNVDIIFDLEDKVVFKGTAMIRININGVQDANGAIKLAFTFF